MLQRNRAEILEGILRAIVNLEDEALEKVWYLLQDGEVAYGHIVTRVSKRFERVGETGTYAEVQG